MDLLSTCINVENLYEIQMRLWHEIENHTRIASSVVLVIFLIPFDILVARSYENASSPTGHDTRGIYMDAAFNCAHKMRRKELDIDKMIRQHPDRTIR